MNDREKGIQSKSLQRMQVNQKASQLPLMQNPASGKVIPVKTVSSSGATQTIASQR